MALYGVAVIRGPGMEYVGETYCIDCSSLLYEAFLRPKVAEINRHIKMEAEFLIEAYNLMCLA